MKFSKKLTLALLLLILLLASVLRFWQLGATPNGLDWDEVSFGYNAYSILHTGRDEYGAFLPIVLKSYGDYKPALYAYLDIPAVAVFDLNAFSVRIPSAVIGVLTVFLVFFLVKEFFKRNDIALLSSFLLAISPWHIQFSRAAFEANVGVFFNVLGTLLFLKGLKKPWFLIPSVISFALTIYVYQSLKVFTPLLVILLVALFFKQLLTIPKKVLLITIIVGTLVFAPMAFYTLFSPNGIARAQGVSIFISSSKVSQNITTRYLYNKATANGLGLILDNGRFIYIKEAIGNYLSHFDVNWLFISGDISRHHAPDMGLLYLWELPFILVGLYQLIFGKYDKKIKLLIFGWFLLAPLPASVTQGVPHAFRTMNFLPMHEIFIAVGLVTVFGLLKKKKIVYSAVLFIVAVIGLYNFMYYLDQYFVQLNYFNALDWQYGYNQIVPTTVNLGKSYQHIVVDGSGQFSQSYMFYLFYLKENPQFYQKAGNQNPSGIHEFGKYTFRPIDWKKDMNTTNTLFVGNPSDFPIPLPQKIQIINNTDGMPLAEFVGR